MGHCLCFCQKHGYPPTAPTALGPFLTKLAAQNYSILYVSADGPGIPMVPEELAGRKGKQADGYADRDGGNEQMRACQTMSIPAFWSTL
jgi:hypothetical protein